MLNTFLSYELISRDFSRAIDQVEKQPVVARDTAYYLENIGKVKTIDEFVKNDRLFRYAMKAHGLEDMAYAKAFMVKVLKEGISDEDSFANKLTDKRYAEFAAAFNFEKYGEAATSYTRAANEAPKNFASTVALGILSEGFDYAAGEVGYYVSNISDVESIDDLMADTRLLSVALGAFGLDVNEEPAATVRQMLEGGVSDPNSPANLLADKRYANFVTAFNFVQNGAATTDGVAAQNAPKQFMINAGFTLVKPSTEFVTGETDYYSSNIGRVKSITALLDDPRLLRVAMSAYGLDADTEDPATIRKMLLGGVTDPVSPANLLADKRYARFVTAFNFVENGADTTRGDAVLKDTLKLYKMRTETGLIESSKYFLETETKYYLANIGKIETVDQFLANKQVRDFALVAHGLDPAVETTARIREMLLGGVTDPNSPANKLTDKKYVAFVTTYNFAEYGAEATTRTPAMEPSVAKFMRQTLEEDAGQENEGVRLALYFERKAEGIDNVFQILADPALSRVVRTALGMPESLATANIDRQADLIEKRLDLEDLQDPEKLGEFLERFTTMWEIDNPTSTQQASISVLFAQPTTVGVSTDLLLSMQKLRF